MKNLYILVSIIIVVAVTAGTMIFLRGDSDSVADTVVEENSVSKAPTFSLADYDGNLVASKDFNGKILVLNTWAVWCPFCVNELSEFKELQKAFPEEIVVVAINRAESLSLARNFTDKLGLSDSYVFLIDPKDSFYKSIGGFSMPETLFVSIDGGVFKHKRGPLEFPEMKKIVESMLAQK